MPNLTMPMAPIEPDKKKLAMMGFVLALGIGVGLVLLAEMLDRAGVTLFAAASASLSPRSELLSPSLSKHIENRIVIGAEESGDGGLERDRGVAPGAPGARNRPG